MDASEIIIAACTLTGPILAVQAQKAVERATANRDRRNRIFETLISTYTTRISPAHVQALNMIELAFNSRRFSSVVEAWRTYLVHLNTDQVKMGESERIAHFGEGDRLFRALMYEMSSSLGYGVTKDMLARGMYHPLGQLNRELAEVKLLDGAARVFAGEQNLGMDIKSIAKTDNA